MHPSHAAPYRPWREPEPAARPWPVWPRLWRLAPLLLAMALAAALPFLRGCQAEGAPVPRPKVARKARPARPDGFCGVWKATWGATPGEMEFREDGWYRHTIGQARFTGRWRWDENGWLAVEERGGEEPPPAGAGMRWKVSLLHDGGGMRGRCEGDFGAVDVALRPGGPGA